MRWLDAALAGQSGKTTFEPVSFQLNLPYEVIKLHHWKEQLSNLLNKTSFNLLILSTVTRIFALIFIGSFQLRLPFGVLKKHKDHCQYRLRRACTRHVSSFLTVKRLQ